MKRLAIAAVGLALVVGIVVGDMVGNPFDGRASASTAGVGGRLISLGRQTVAPNAGYLSPIVDVSHCTQVRAMAAASGDVGGDGIELHYYGSPDGTTVVAGGAFAEHLNATVGGVSTASALWGYSWPHVRLTVINKGLTATDITAWLWCA